jgi:hypothetical protein
MKISLQTIIKKINNWIYNLDHSTPLDKMPKPPPVSLPEDEIVGEWENGLNDGSGLHAFWGYAYIFNEDGTGKSYMWEQGKVNDEYTYTFFWKRLGPNTIEVKTEEDDEGEILDYNITTVGAPYGGSLYKLTTSNYVPNEFCNEGFWNVYGPVFKSKSPI